MTTFYGKANKKYTESLKYFKRFVRSNELKHYRLRVCSDQNQDNECRFSWDDWPLSTRSLCFSYHSLITEKSRNGASATYKNSINGLTKPDSKLTLMNFE